MNIISIEGMEFRAPIGCFEEEKVVYPTFLVDLYIEYDASKAMKSDLLENAINYQEVYLRIKKIMQNHHNLVEHVVSCIMDDVLTNFNLAMSVRCKVHKTFPALGGRIAAVAFEAEKSRNI